MHKCIFIDAKCSLSVRDISEQYRPHGGQALIKVEYSGINPADIAHALHLGLNNNVCGYEFCGTVVEAGPVSLYAVGDVVFGSNEAGKNRPQYHGAHQDFLLAESDSMSAKLSVDIPHAHAAALSIMVRTAADALINQFDLAFPAIGVHGSKTTGALVIWGGASTVGTAAIQLAKAMKFDLILVTASPSNHEALLHLGASQCFDYNDPEVVRSIRTAVEKSGLPLAYVFDTVCKHGSPGTIELCESLSRSAETKFACCLPQPQNPRWKMVLASRSRDFPSPPPLAIVKGSPEWDLKLEKAVEWAMKNYAKDFRIPNVTVVSGGQEGIQAIQDVFVGKRSFQKVVIQHPL